MVMLVADVGEDCPDEKLSGTAGLPASSTSAVMFGYAPAAPGVTGLAVRLKPLSRFDVNNPQLLLGPPENPRGRGVPVGIHQR